MAIEINPYAPFSPWGLGPPTKVQQHQRRMAAKSANKHMQCFSPGGCTADLRTSLVPGAGAYQYMCIICNHRYSAEWLMEQGFDPTLIGAQSPKKRKKKLKTDDDGFVLID